MLKIEKPPVVLVIAAMRFAQPPLALLAAEDPRLSDLHDALTSALVPLGLTEIARHRVQQVTMTGDLNGSFATQTADSVAFSATDRARQIGVSLGPGGLSCRSTGEVYLGHDWFVERIGAALAAVTSVEPRVDFDRVGLRYLDLLTASGERPVADYLSPPFAEGAGHLQLSDRFTTEEHMQIAVLHDEVGARLVLRCSRGHGQLRLPADVAHDELGLLPARSVEGDFVLLDIDHFHEVGGPSSVIKDSMATLSHLNSGIRDVFTGMLSDVAKAEWGVVSR